MSRVVALVEDLMFLSRVREAAAGAGVEVQAVGSVEELLEACRPGGVALVVLDLDSPRVPAAEALRRLRAEAQGVASVGFFSHVHPERGRDALAAGCGRVLPRSVFVKELESLLAPPRG